MKKLILAAIAITCAVSVFAQGTITFNNRTTAGFSRVLGPAPGNPSLSLQGNSPTVDNPPGVVDYAAQGMTLLAGPNYFAQLIGAEGQNMPEASLVPQGGTATFRTGAAAGFLFPTVVTLSTINKDVPWATFQLVAWDNSSGLYPTWAEAFPAWQELKIAAGKSLVFNVDSIGGDVNTPPFLTGLTSFNIYFVIPEPGSFALLGLGAAALLIFRRRK